jgi:hypothetical protein
VDEHTDTSPDQAAANEDSSHHIAPVESSDLPGHQAPEGDRIEAGTPESTEPPAATGPVEAAEPQRNSAPAFGPEWSSAPASAGEAPLDMNGTWAAGEPARSRSAWAKPVVIAVVALVVVAGIAVGALAFALRGSSDTITKLVPSDASVYATVYLDPALSQKLAIRNLMKKFPAVDTTGELNNRLNDFFDSAFEGSGISFEQDVAPWIGGQLGAVVKVENTATSAALLIASKDDAAATAALSKLKGQLGNNGDSFTTEQHGGVTLTIGTPSSGTDKHVFGMVGHTVIFASATTIAESVIDTSQGSHANITSSAGYTNVQKGLPKDRLAMVFIDAAPLIKDLEQSDLSSAAAAGLPGPVTALEAYRAAGITVSAADSGITVDVSVDLDASKLSAEQRASLTAAPHDNTTYRFVPRSSYVLIAGENLDRTIRAGVNAAIKQDPSVKDNTDELGLTGSGNVVDTLTGDYALTAGPGYETGGFPGVALVAGTKDLVKMQHFLDHSAGELFGGLTGTASTTEQYQGVTITYWEAPPDSVIPISPAYAVTDGMAIVALSPGEIKGVIDAKGGTNITDSVNYQAAQAAAVSNTTSVVYVDVEAVAAAVRDQLPADARESFDTNVEPNLEHVKAFLMTGGGSIDHQSLRMFVLVR